MTALFHRIAVVGLGLLGGSVALAARSRGVADVVVGATRQPEARAQALRSGAVDAVLPLDEVARDADLVVLATPVYAMPAVLERLRSGLAEGAIVTDVGSVKTSVGESLSGVLPAGVHYVGSHPMAGGHERGLSFSRPDLFERAPCVVATEGDPAAVARVAAFWRALGAHVVCRDSETHDAEVAWTSHVPHLLAFAFAHALDHAPAGASELVGPGFAGFTRIAWSDPELWADILTANRKAIASPLEAVGASLQAMARAVEAGDAETLEELLAAARQSLFRTSPASGAGETDRTENPSFPDREATPTRRSTQSS